MNQNTRFTVLSSVASAALLLGIAAQASAQLLGAPTVSRASSGIPVTVNNTSSNPIPVQPQFTPVQGSVTLSFPPNNTGWSAVLYTVPAGQRLVIHYVGGYGPQSGQVSTFEVQTTVNGQTVTYTVPTLPDNRTVSQSVYFVADSGTQVVVNAGISIAFEGVLAEQFSFSGELISAP